MSATGHRTAVDITTLIAQSKVRANFITAFAGESHTVNSEACLTAVLVSSFVVKLRN